jgi:hypothetical protein
MKQDSAFYTNEAGSEVVWDGDESGRFYVVRNGEMRIHAITEAGEAWIIRYTDQLERFGITNDKELHEWTDKGELVFDWIHNSWFEIVDNDEPDYGEVYHELDEAVERAIHLSQRTNNDERKND